MTYLFRTFLPLLSHCTVFLTLMVLSSCYLAKSFPFWSLSSIGKKYCCSTLFTTTTNDGYEADALYTVRLVSWNLLAPLYATPLKYPSSSSRHLEWNFRQNLIVQQLKLLEADILCLQEVQTDLWPELQRELEMLGYTQVCVQNVTRNHPVTIVTLLRDGIGTFGAVESRSRALITAIELNHHDHNNNNNQETALFLANVHLEAGMKEDDNETRFFQIRSLLNRLQTHIQAEKEKHTEIYSNNMDDKVGDYPLILVGDFNMLRDNPIHRLLINGNLPEKEMEELSNLRTKYLPLLPLRDAYLYHQKHQHLSEHLPTEEATTYRGGYVLDYLWTSVERIKIRETYNVEEIIKNFPLSPATEDNDSASTMATAAPMSDEQGPPRRKRAAVMTTTTNMPRRRNKWLPWPDAQHPSDHLPIGATLELW